MIGSLVPFMQQNRGRTMLHPALRHAVFVRRFVEAVTWQPLRTRLASRPLARAVPHDRQDPSSDEVIPARAA